MKDASGSSFHRLLIKAGYSILMILMRKQNPNQHVSKIEPIFEHDQKSRSSVATSNKLKHSQNVIFDMSNLTPTPTPPSVKNKPRAKARELIFKMLEKHSTGVRRKLRSAANYDFQHISVFPRGYGTLYPLDKMDDFMDK